MDYSATPGEPNQCLRESAQLNIATWLFGSMPRERARETPGSHCPPTQAPRMAQGGVQAGPPEVRSFLRSPPAFYRPRVSDPFMGIALGGLQVSLIAGSDQSQLVSSAALPCLLGFSKRLLRPRIFCAGFAMPAGFFHQERQCLIALVPLVHRQRCQQLPSGFVRFLDAAQTLEQIHFVAQRLLASGCASTAVSAFSLSDFASCARPSFSNKTARRRLVHTSIFLLSGRLKFRRSNLMLARSFLP